MGFDVDKFVSRVSEDRKCSLCHWVLDNPVRSACCHVFCSGCILPWVVRHGTCPHKCRTLTPGDLENVLPLRELILNMQVRCDFQTRGCKQTTIRLKQLEAHLHDCECRPVACRNKGCNVTTNSLALGHHEGTECQYRAVGICQKGCGLVLLSHSAEQHDCVEALLEHIAGQELHVATLEHDNKRSVSKFSKREKSLLAQLACIHSEAQTQALKFQRTLNNYRNQICQLSRLNGEAKVSLFILIIYST
jgi:ligand of Numb protein X 3/4